MAKSNTIQQRLLILKEAWEELPFVSAAEFILSEVYPDDKDRDLYDDLVIECYVIALPANPQEGDDLAYTYYDKITLGTIVLINKTNPLITPFFKGPNTSNIYHSVKYSEIIAVEANYALMKSLTSMPDMISMSETYYRNKHGDLYAG